MEEKSKIELELEVLKKIVEALVPLERDEQVRIVQYLFSRYVTKK